MNPDFDKAWFHCSITSPPERFCIVTAYNPPEETRNPEGNEEANRALEQALGDLGCRTFRFDAGAKDRSHIEVSFGAELPLEAGLQLGRQFRQEAIFWVDSGKVFQVDCATEERKPHGNWHERLVPEPAVGDQPLR